MVARKFSNIAVETELASGISDSDGQLTVLSSTGWPAAPFTIIVDEGTASEEIILVGGKSGDIFNTLTRGFGGSTASVHSGAAVVRHCVVAEDFRAIWEHAHDGADDSAGVAHADLSGISTDDHHAKAHTIDGPDHTGTLSHAVLDTVTANDHHAQLHAAAHAEGAGDEFLHAAQHATGQPDELILAHSSLLTPQDDELVDIMEEGTDITLDDVAWTTFITKEITIPAHWVTYHLDIDLFCNIQAFCTNVATSDFATTASLRLSVEGVVLVPISTILTFYAANSGERGSLAPNLPFATTTALVKATTTSTPTILGQGTSGDEFAFAKVTEALLRIRGRRVS